MAVDTPQSLRGRSIYQIFVRNFSQEGTFDAALPALERARRLGFDFVCLLPIHPIGTAARKGRLGSPYAIADYRAVDPALGGESAFCRFVDAAHGLGLKVLIDVVYNHTSPDSVLAREHGEWFWKDGGGRPAPRFADWSDVVDLDYTHRELWDYQIATLELWAERGVDGFRCDVASLVPLEFWKAARSRLASRRRIVWLAESVHKEFVAEVRSRGMYAACDAELHEAFDLSYDYDSRAELEAAWSGEGSIAGYLRALAAQSATLPVHAVKTRFLENHDQPRAAFRFGRGARLKNWTLFTMLLDGVFLAYMGEECAIERRPSLFDKDPVDWSSGDAAFEAWFGAAHRATKAVRSREPCWAAQELQAGVVLLERSGGVRRVVALLNLDGRSGRVTLPEALAGRDLLTGERMALSGRVELRMEPIVLELARP